MALEDAELVFIPIYNRAAAAIAATVTLKAGVSPPTFFSGSLPALELVDAQIYDTTAITGDNTNRYSVNLCKGTVAAPISMAWHDFVTGADLAADVPKHMTIDGTGQAGSTTLNGAITKTAVTAVVTAATSFPQTGQFRIKVEDEVMIVTAGAGTTSFTVTRAADGTVATSHATGVTVVLFYTGTTARVTSTDVFHAVLTKNGAAANLSINFMIGLWFSTRMQYAGRAYPQ